MTSPEERERLQTLRDCGWAILGIVSSLEAGETPAHTVGEMVERLERVRGEGTDGRDTGGGVGHCSTT